MQTTRDSANGAHQAALIAGRFSDLQGLRQAVAGLGLVLLFGWELVFPLSRADIRVAGFGSVLWGTAVLVAGWAVVIGGVLWVNGWYRRHYGQVQRTRKQRWLGAVIGGSGTLAFLVPFEIDVFAQNYDRVVPANLMLFGVSLWIIAYWLYIGRPFWHYLLLAGIGFVLGIVSIAGMPPSTFSWHLREATLFMAVASTAGGVIDHLVLARSLRPPKGAVGLES